MALPLLLGGMAAGGVGSAIGGMFGSSAAEAQIQAMREAIEYQKQQDALTRKELKPYVDFGTEQLGVYDNWLSDPNVNPMSMMDPGYEFRRSEGMKGLTGNAATSGMLQSGDTLRGIQRYGQDLASSEYGNAFNRWLQKGQFLRDNAGVGSDAALRVGALANQGAANVGNMTADTDWGAPDKVWGDVATGLGGVGANALMRFGGMGRNMPGGSNIFRTAYDRYGGDLNAYGK